MALNSATHTPGSFGIAAVPREAPFRTDQLAVAGPERQRRCFSLVGCGGHCVTMRFI